MYFSENIYLYGRPLANKPDMEKWLEREIQLAKNIQTKLLNGSVPDVKGAEVKGLSIPARLIGGDYYDFYPLGNGKVRIVIGDVMGKGIPAAMLMILTRGAFRSASESSKSPSQTLTAMNKALCQDLRSLKSFVTLVCADWDPHTNVLTYASAGHMMPLLLKSKERKVVELPKTLGIMVGAFPEYVYEEKEIALETDDVVLFYTDGIIEAENRKKEQFQRDRLIRALLKYASCPAHQAGQRVIEDIYTFTEGAMQKDDMTMVIVKIHQET